MIVSNNELSMGGLFILNSLLETYDETEVLMKKIRYHVNDDGVVGPCSAQEEESCPFKGEHFDTPHEARMYYEAKRSGESFGVLQKPKLVKLHDVVDLELLKEMLEDGYVYSNGHEDDDTLRILNYGPKTQYEGKWNDVTKLARGLIVQTSSDEFNDALVVQRPWKKFFTLQQLDSEWHIGDEENVNAGDIKIDELDFNAPAEVTEKLDGSLGILYRDPKGELAFSTRGSFHSDQAKDFTRFMRSDDDLYGAAERLMRENPDTTFLYELVGPDNQIVLQYEETDAILLGGVDKESGRSFSPADYTSWSEAGLNSAEVMPLSTLKEALEFPDREGKEGLVVRFLSEEPSQQHQIKIKQEDYLQLHRIATHMSVSGMRQNIRESEADFSTIKSLADEDITSLSKINEQLSLLEEKGLEWQREAMEERYKEVLVPAAKNFLRAYEEVGKIDADRLKGRDAIKNFVLNFRGPRQDRAMYIELFKARMSGENPSPTYVQRYLTTVGREIKG